MRKKSVNHLADTIFWYIIYFLPVLCYLIYIFTSTPITDGANIVNFYQFSWNSGFVTSNSHTNSIIYNVLSSSFGTNGILPLFTTQAPFIIFHWFVSCYIIHLAIDFLIFFPRLCHKWMDKYTKED